MTGRAVLLEYRLDGRQHRGSGWRLHGTAVLTADHCAAGTDHRVIVDGHDAPATVVARSGTTEVDIAVLDAPDLPPIDEHTYFARVDTSVPQVVPDCTVLGFPPAVTGGKRTGQYPGQVLTGDGRSPHERQDHPYKPTFEFATPADLRTLTLGGRTRLQSPWPGLSGAAVTCAGRIIGVIDSHDLERGLQRVLFTPITMIDLLEPRTAARLQSALGLPPIDDLPLLPDPLESFLSFREHKPLVSPASMLHAQAGVIEFAGRTTELDELQRWCGAADPGLMLLYGPGGQGKTRLALQFAAQLREHGWIAGAAPPDTLARIEFTDALARRAGPTLIVVDYAESHRPGPVDNDDPLLRLLRIRLPHLRFLLIARSAGAWFEELADKVESPRRLLALTPLADRAEARSELYASARHALAARLPEVTSDAGVDWPMIEKSLDTPRVLADSRYRHALSLYERALVDLLQAGPHPIEAPGTVETTVTIETTLLRHEQRYWRLAARSHGLDLSPGTLREAVAGITLFGAGHPSQARTTIDLLPGLAEESADTKRRAVDWLMTLYPDPRRPWAPLEPDSLGEQLVAETWATDDRGPTALLAAVEPSLLGDRTATLADDQIHQMQVVLARAAQSRETPAMRHRLDEIRRGIRAYETARPDLDAAAEPDRWEYLRFAALRVGARLVADRAGPAGAAQWRARWTHWTSRRPSRTLGVDGTRALVPLGPGTVLTVGRHVATVTSLVTGPTDDVCFSPRTLGSRTIDAAARCTFEGQQLIAFVCGTGTLDGTLIVCRLPDGAPLGPPCQVPIGSVSTPIAFGVAGSGPVVLVAGHEPGIRVWDAVRGVELAPIDGVSADALAMGELDDEPVFVAARERLEVFSATTRRRLRPPIDFGFPNASALTIADLPAGPAAVVGCTDGTLRVIDLDSGRDLWHLTGHTQEIRTVSTAEFQGRAIALTAGADRSVMFWDLINGEGLGEPYTGHRDEIRSSTFHRIDGRLVGVTSDRDGATRVWNVAASRYPEDPFVGHTDRVIGVGVLTGGTPATVVTVAEDRTVRTWDLDSGRPTAGPIPTTPFPSHRPTSFALAEGPDSSYAAVGDAAGGVAIVNLGDRTRSTPTGLDHRIVALDCRADGEPVVAAADSTGAVRGWRVADLEPVGPPARIPCAASHLLLTETDHEAIVAWTTQEADRPPSSTCRTVDLTGGRIDPRGLRADVAGRIVGLFRYAGHPCAAVTSTVTSTTNNPSRSTVQVIDLRTARPLGSPWSFPTDRVRRTILPANTDLLLVVGYGGELWVRSLAHLLRHDDGAIAVVGLSDLEEAGVAATVATRSGRPIVLTGDNTGAIRTIDPGTREVSSTLVAPAAIAVGGYRGNPVAAIAYRDSAVVELRDIASGHPVGPLLTGESAVTSLAAATVSGRPVIVGGSKLGPRVWNTEHGDPIPSWQRVGDARKPRAVVHFGGRAAIVTSVDIGTGPTQLALHAVAGGEAVGRPAVGLGRYSAIAAAVLDDRPIAFSGSFLDDPQGPSPYDVSIRCWDLLGGNEIGRLAAPNGVAGLAVDSGPAGTRVFAADFSGRIDEWLMTFMPGRFDSGFERPHSVRVRHVIGASVTALAIAPGHGLIAARGDVLELRPFDQDVCPVRMSAPILDLAVSADTRNTVLVATTEGIVALDLPRTPAPLRMPR